MLDGGDACSRTWLVSGGDGYGGGRLRNLILTWPSASYDDSLSSAIADNVAIFDIRRDVFRRWEESRWRRKPDARGRYCLSTGS